MSSPAAEHPLLHPNFVLVCLSLEAWDFKREHKARRPYVCRFCSEPIPAGTVYAAHSDRAAHIECRDEFRKMTPNAKSSDRHPTNDDGTASRCDEGSRLVSSRKPVLAELSAAVQCDQVGKPPSNTPQIGDGRPGSTGAVADRAEGDDLYGK